ncbi:hypothetical protein QTN25_001665 [Entamoeba marina]
MGNITSFLFPQNDLKFMTPGEFIFYPQLFYDGSQKGGVIQRNVGDCYFLAALSALAENQDRIKNLIRCLGFDAYKITFYSGQGEARQFIIDSVILCKWDETSNKYQPYYSKNKNNEL